MDILKGEFRCPSPLPSGLSTGKVKRFRNFLVTNIYHCYRVMLQNVLQFLLTQKR